MTVYALEFTVGISSGYATIIGIYSTNEKAEDAKTKHMKDTAHMAWHYKITPIEVDRTLNITYMEW